MRRVGPALKFACSALLWWATPSLAGHCNYVQQGRGETYPVCETPTDEAACAAVGQDARNSDAVYAAGACPTNGLVGVCDKGASQISYFSGEPSQLEIGCGFQGGTWVNPS